MVKLLKLVIFISADFSAASVADDNVGFSSYFTDFSSLYHINLSPFVSYDVIIQYNLFFIYRKFFVILNQKSVILHMRCIKMNLYENCTLCPRSCNVNREAGQRGYCKMTSEITASLASVHMWEEPPISGTNGSGTIFFTGCNLGCVFCQNYSISSQNKGKAITCGRLSEIMLEEQARGVHNINLVTGVHFIPSIISAVEKAKSNGLKIPIVYNSSGYEKAESIKMLDGIVDVYLPDIKYFSCELSAKYSNAKDYFNFASEAVTEMYRQTGGNTFDENGILKKGVIIRHMVLPSCREDSYKILDWIRDNIGAEAYVSILNQYTPVYKANEYREINRRLMSLEYTRVIEHFFDIGLKNGYMQEKSSATSEYTPIFDFSGL